MKGFTLLKVLLPVLVLALVMALTSAAPVQTAADQDGKVRVWVEFQPGAKGQVQAALNANLAEVHYTFDDLNAFVVSLPQAALEGIRRNPNVVLVEEDAMRQLYAQEQPYGIGLVQAPKVWASGYTGANNPTVCIIDSGLYTGHEDFNFANMSVDGYPAGWNTDGCGHGTHVAGTIAAADNGVGVVGVAPGLNSLYIVKVFGDSCGWTYSSTLVDAANRCDAAGAKIISMSLGGTTKLVTEEKAFANLYNKGVLSIAAAGNDGNTRVSYPGGYSSVVSIAAVDQNEVVADFSQKNSTVELAAPGVGVLSTVPWLSDNSVTVDGIAYKGGSIEFAKLGTASGALVNGGLCDAAGAWGGKVVLCERGVISFLDKVVNVQKGGGAAAVIYNNVPGDFAGTLGEGSTSTIPAISLSQESGKVLVDNNNLGKSATVASTLTKPASGYEAWDGTSMATPHVSGIAALIWSVNPSWTNVQIRDALVKTAKDLGTAGKDNSYGYGLVQAQAALNYLLGGVTPPPTPTTAPTSDPTLVPSPTPTLTPTAGPAALSVDVSTKASYLNGETAIITVTATSGTTSVSGATVNIVITTPKGTRYSGSGTTGLDGKVSFNFKLNTSKDGTGTYIAAATVTKSGYADGSGSTTFTASK
jgi:serine protease